MRRVSDQVTSAVAHFTTAPSGPDAPTVLYLGLRRSPLEWQAELDAATALGLRVHVSSDSDVSHTGLPAEQRGSFDRTTPLADQAARAAPDEAPAAVACWGDRHVGLTARLAEDFGVRGIGTAAAAVSTDKVAQRRAMEPYGLNPAWRPGRTPDALRAAVEALGASGKPLVFKPAHCSGGRGIALITADSDLDDVFELTAENYTGTTDFLVEEYADGSEHSVSGLVADGTVRILGVTDKYLEGPLSASWATTVPSARTDAQVAQLKRAAEQAVLAVGLRTGGFHVDLRFTAEGPVVLEIGGRLGGDLINSHLIPLGHQGAVRPYQALLTLLTTGELSGEPAEPTQGAAMVLLPKAGRPVTELVGTALAHPRVALAADWPGTDTLVAVVVTEDPAELPAAVADVRRLIPS